MPAAPIRIAQIANKDISVALSRRAAVSRSTASSTAWIYEAPPAGASGASAPSTVRAISAGGLDVRTKSDAYRRFAFADIAIYAAGCDVPSGPPEYTNGTTPATVNT